MVDLTSRKVGLTITAVICAVACLSTITAMTRDSGHETLSLHRLQIVDGAGNPRITLSTDASGTARISFLGSTSGVASVIEQFRDGNMRVEFGGAKSGKPSVVLQTDIRQGGPALMMRGDGREQIIMLGFQSDDSAQPGASSKLWGLFYPGTKPFNNLAAIGVSEDLNSGERHGFIIPPRGTNGDQW